MKKRIISIFLVTVLIFSALPLISAPVAAAASPEAEDVQSAVPTADSDWYANETGDDTPNDLYIYNEDDFVAFGAKIGEANSLANATAFDGKVIHIMADLDMSGYANWYNSGIKRGRFFNGIIDGHNHVIRGLKWEYIYSSGTTINTGATYAGLLGGIIVPGTYNDAYGAYAGVFNLGIVDSGITCGAKWIGGLFGSVGNTNQEADTNAIRLIKFENLYIDVDVTSHAQTADSAALGDINSAIYVGGVFGQQYKSFDVEMNNVVYAGDIKVIDETVTDRVGGFIGEFSGINGEHKSTLRMNKCAFYGTVSVKNGYYVSGYIGCVSNAIENDDDSFLIIENCIAAGYMNCGTTAKSGVFFKCGNASAVLVIRNSFYINQYDGIVLSENNDTANSSGVVGNGTNTNVETPAALAQTVIEGYVNTYRGVPELTNPYPTVVPFEIVNIMWRADHASADTSADGFDTAVVGFQSKVAGDSLQLRLIGLVNDMNGDGSLDDEYTSVGFDIVMMSPTGADGTIWSNRDPETNELPVIKTVYTGVRATLASSEETVYSAEELGGDYIYVATVAGIMKNVGEVTFVVRTFHDGADGRIYDDVCTITYDTTVES